MEGEGGWVGERVLDWVLELKVNSSLFQISHLDLGSTVGIDWWLLVSGKLVTFFLWVGFAMFMKVGEFFFWKREKRGEKGRRADIKASLKSRVDNLGISGRGGGERGRRNVHPLDADRDKKVEKGLDFSKHTSSPCLRGKFFNRGNFNNALCASILNSFHHRLCNQIRL